MTRRALPATPARGGLCLPPCGPPPSFRFSGPATDSADSGVRWTNASGVRRMLGGLHASQGVGTVGSETAGWLLWVTGPNCVRIRRVRRTICGFLCRLWWRDEHTVSFAAFLGHTVSFVLNRSRRRGFFVLPCHIQARRKPHFRMSSELESIC